MAETYTLSTPQAQSSVTGYAVRFLHLNWDGQYIEIGYRASGGAPYAHTYTGATAVSLMTSLNKANLTTNSLHKRILNQLATDGVIGPGSVTGAPD